ncbi:ATP-grasp fold amidoligase family protein [Qipengyuania sp. CAU 1752]
MNLRTFPALPHWLIPFPEVRISLTYLWRHRRLPNLRNPQLFSELVQRRKLSDRNPGMTMLVDKVAAKAHVARLLGESWTIPTLWTGRILPIEAPWPFPFILKASHGCNQNVICHDASDWHVARQKAAKWQQAPYGLWLDEWAYLDVPRGYIVEPYLGTGERLPTDYKIYVFGGRAALVQVHLDRNGNHRWILYDRYWEQISMFDEEPTLAPVSIEKMIIGAEMIAQPFDFARIDFYEIDGEPKFGEATFYPGSGLDPFDPPDLDKEIGALWLAANQDRELGHDKRDPQPIAA